jgi:hypothetical protein
MSTIFIVDEHGVRARDEDGWRDPVPGEEVTTDDGSNHVTVNTEGYYVGLWHGGLAVFVVMCLVLVAMGIMQGG